MLTSFVVLLNSVSLLPMRSNLVTFCDDDPSGALLSYASRTIVTFDRDRPTGSDLDAAALVGGDVVGSLVTSR